MTELEDAAKKAADIKRKFDLDIAIASAPGPIQNRDSYINEAKELQLQYLEEARTARDEFVAYLRGLQASGQISNTQLKNISTVTSAWDPATGRVYLGWKLAGDGKNWCAEPDCEAQAARDGVKPRTLQYTETVRPRDGENWPRARRRLRHRARPRT